MEPERIQQIADLVSATSPGPWYTQPGTQMPVWVFDRNTAAVVAQVFQNNADFIAQSKTIVPELLAEIERLQQVVARLNEGYNAHI